MISFDTRMTIREHEVMKVLFDVTSLLTKNLTTDGIYTKNLFRVLRGIGIDTEPVYKAPKGIKDNFIEYHTGHSAKKFIGLFASKGSILHGPSGNLLSESEKFKKVISINDLSMFREGFLAPRVAEQLQTHMKQQIQGDIGAVIVPSYEVHNEFLVRFPKMVNKTHVVEPGSDHIMESSSTYDKPLIENPYFLFVGTIDKKSNLAGIVKAFHAFSKMQQNVHLAVAGDSGFGSEAILKLINSSSIRDRIHILGFKQGAELKKLYSDAIGTVIPSYYEGFSFPLVESMRMGCPVITSALGTLKEIGGDAVHLVNPKDTEQIMAAMERIYVDRVYRDKLKAIGQEQAQSLIWLSCAKKIFKIYQSL